MLCSLLTYPPAIVYSVLTYTVYALQPVFSGYLCVKYCARGCRDTETYTTKCPLLENVGPA